MSYSSDETTSAVQQIVKGTLSFPSDRLGPRDVNTPYQEVVELINSVLLYEPDAIFYLIYLASKTLSNIAAAEQTTITDVLDAVDDLLKPVIPIEDVTGFGEASTALSSMESALGRSGTIGVREYSRYSNAVDRIKQSIGRSVKLTHTPRGSAQQTTEIVRPASEAKSDVTTYFSILETIHADLLALVDQLLVAYSEFGSADLAESVASEQITRARTVMSGLDAEMTPLTPRERVSHARSALLDTLAARAAIKATAARVDPGAPKVVQLSSATPTYRLTAYGSGTAPLITGAVSAPWPIEEGINDELKFDLNGSSLTAIDLLPVGESYPVGIEVASLTGGNQGDFQIGADLATPYSLLTKEVSSGTDYSVNGTTLYIVVDGVSLTVDFTSDRNATEVTSDINTAISSYVTATKRDGGGNDWVEIAWSHSSPPEIYHERYLEVTSGPDNADDLGAWRIDDPGGPTAGEESRGWDGNNILKIHPNDQSTTTSVSLTSGDWPDYYRTATQVASDIAAAAPTHFTSSATGDDHIQIDTVASWKGEGAVLKIITDGVAATGKPSVSHAAAFELGFFPNQEDRKKDVDGYVVSNVLNNNSDFNEAARATVRREDVLSTAGAQYSASTSIFVVLLDEDTDPSTDWTCSELKLSIGGGENAGIYGITGSVWTAATHTLLINLNRGLRELSASRPFDITVYKELLEIESRDATTAGSIDLDEALGTSAHIAIGLPTTEALGGVTKILIEYNDPVTSWVPANLRINHIHIGDKLVQLDGTEVATVTGVSEIENGLVSVTSVSPDLSMSSFKIESAAYEEYLTFVAALQGWKNSTLPPYESDLKKIDKLLSPILLLEGPSKDRVNTVYSEVESLQTIVSSLQTVLDQFSVNSIPSVTNILSTLQERGYNRSRDLLLKAEIEEFFNTVSNTSSYSRAATTAASEVTVEDINEPTRRIGEFDDEIDRVAAHHFEEDVHPDYDFRDAEREFPESTVEYWPSWEDQEDA